MMGAITRVFLPKGLWITALATLLTISGCSGGGSDAQPPSSAPSYSISVSATPSAGGIVTGDGVYSDGSRVSVTASPSTGYHFVNWTEGGTEVSTLASYSFSATADRSLVANFGINSYTVSTRAGPNGTISQTSATVNHGDTTSFTVTPANGYSIASVSGCSGSLNGTPTTYTTGQITADCTVSATFIAGGGTSTFFTIGTSVMPTAGGVVSGGGSYSSASSVTLTAAPNTGYHFVNWTEGGTVISTATSLTFTASADRNLVANFSINRYTVGTSAGPNGTISPTSTTVNHGGTTSFTITPANGYSIGSVNGCNGVLNVTSATYTTGQITADCTVTAGFVVGSAKPLHTIGVNAVPSGSGGVSGGGAYSDGSSVTVTATPNTGYHFVNWTEGGAEVSTLPSYTFSATADRTLVANFALNTYTIGATAAPTAGGVVSGGSTYNHGDAVTLTATANTGYQFVNWTEGGTVVSTAPSLTFTVTADRTLVANFALNTYTIGATVVPVAGGAVAGIGTYNHGDAVTLTATANTGYHFVNWTEGGTVLSTATSLTFTANADRTLSANFAPNTYTISVGTAPAAGGSSSGGGSYTYGSSFTLTATANAGYHFVNWTESGTVVSTAPSLTFTVTADRTLVANFALNTYSIGATVIPVAGGAVAGGGTYNHGDAVTLTATANTGYHFVNWTEGGTEVSTATSLSFTANADRTLSANFAPNTYTINVGTAPAAGGSSSGGGAYSYNSSVTVTATANTGYQFVNWTEGGTVVSTAPSLTFTVTADRTLVANFALISTVTYTGSTPVDGATGVSPIADITVTASAALDPASIDTTSVSLTAELGGSPVVSSALSYIAATNTITINPNISLPHGVKFRLTLSGVRDTLGSVVTTKTIRFTVSVNPALRDISYDATGAVAGYSANTLDATGVIMKTVRYTATGADMTPGTVDDGVGPDGLWFTADDIPDSYQAYSYDAAGNQTRSVWYLAAGLDMTPGTADDGIGPDGIWFTADDIPLAYEAYSYDAAGNQTRSDRYMADGADMTLGTADDGIGPDGIWFTADDVPSAYTRNSFDAAGNKTQISEYSAAGSDWVPGTADDGVGPDGIWFTADDIPMFYETNTYDSAGKLTRTVAYASPGADGVWFNADDVLDAYFTYSRTVVKMTETKYFAAGADGTFGNADDGVGPDGLWFTADDVPVAYSIYNADAAGNVTQISNYSAAGADGVPGNADDGIGPDGIWFTADDVPDDYTRYSYDAAGNMTQISNYSAAGADWVPSTADDGMGPDGIWFTADDIPSFYIDYSFDAAGNRTQSVFYSSAGVDGAWFTPDDVKLSETRFNTIF